MNETTQQIEGMPPVKYDVSEAVLSELRKEAKGADFSTPEGYAEASETYKKVKKLRTTLENRRQELKKPALEYGKLIDSEAKRLTAKILEIEEPLAAAKKAIDDEEERKKQEKIQAEMRRVEGIRKRIDEMKALPTRVMLKTAAEVEKAKAELEQQKVDELYAEFQEEAQRAKAETLGTLSRLLEEKRAAAENAKRAKEAEEQAKAEAEMKKPEPQPQPSQSVAPKPQADKKEQTPVPEDDSGADVVHFSIAFEGRMTRAEINRATAAFEGCLASLFIYGGDEDIDRGQTYNAHASAFDRAQK